MRHIVVIRTPYGDIEIAVVTRSPEAAQKAVEDTWTFNEGTYIIEVRTPQ